MDREKTGNLFYQISFFALLALWIGLTFSSAIVEISFCVALIGWIGVRAFQPKLFSGIGERKVVVPLILFATLSIFSYFWSENQVLSYRGVFKIVQQLLIFWMVIDLFRTKDNLKFFKGSFLFVMALMIADGFYQYYFGYDFIRQFKAADASAGLRVSASFKSYGIFASYLVTTIPLLVAIFVTQYDINKSSYRTWVVGGMIIGTLILLFLTRSRGAFLAFGASFAWFLLINKKFKLIGLFAVLGVVALLLLPKSMVIHLDADGKEQSIVERYYLWDRAVSVIKAKPIQGTGINTYAETHEKYDTTHNWRVRRYYAHNGYLQMAAETGLPTLLCFLAFLFFYFRYGYKSIRQWSRSSDQQFMNGVLMGISGFLFLAAVDTVLHSPQAVMTFWYLMGIGLAHSKVAFAEAGA